MSIARMTTILGTLVLGLCLVAQGALADILPWPPPGGDEDDESCTLLVENATIRPGTAGAVWVWVQGSNHLVSAPQFDVTFDPRRLALQRAKSLSTGSCTATKLSGTTTSERWQVRCSGQWIDEEGYIADLVFRAKPILGQTTVTLRNPAQALVGCDTDSATVTIQ